MADTNKQIHQIPTGQNLNGPQFQNYGTMDNFNLSVPIVFEEEENERSQQELSEGGAISFDRQNADEQQYKTQQIVNDHALNLESRPQTNSEVPRAVSPIVDLSSTNNIMDAILCNLQGLTPEQEEIRKSIEQRQKAI